MKIFNEQFKQYELPEDAKKAIMHFCRRVKITNGKQNSKKHGNPE